MGPYYINQMRLSRGRAAVICLGGWRWARHRCRPGRGPARAPRGSRSRRFKVPLGLPCQPRAGVLGRDLTCQPHTGAQIPHRGAGQGRAGPKLPLGRVLQRQELAGIWEGWGRGLDHPGPVALHGMQTPQFLYPSDSLRTLSSAWGASSSGSSCPKYNATSRHDGNSAETTLPSPGNICHHSSVLQTKLK
ncbi:unnamed protein product [Nyctereutes procyonoides]|uniref:(raccoon dog) hypothetical protein n=1 Tax=Nyctereutes procyonoides TaxID=34880 RepID=A0A811ZIL4_NYCPR|nr:unnamed protein product [Nyctereutes procyonoides]CAD7688314.1 unnamed protein product [Nyctereutes procyonoides]